MRRFLLLYTALDRNYYSEGLMHSNGETYTRDFSPEGGRILYSNMLELENELLNNRDIRHFKIMMLDEREQMGFVPPKIPPKQANYLRVPSGQLICYQCHRANRYPSLSLDKIHHL